MIGGPVYAVAQHQNQVSKEGGGKRSSSVCWESKAKVSNRQHALTDEWVMGYQNIAAVFILLPRMEQTVEEQKKKKSKQTTSRTSCPIGTEAACQYIVLVCVSLRPVCIRAAPPTTVTDACQKLRRLLAVEAKTTAPLC